MLQDLKKACRELVKNPWFTCVTLLTLALGIGANTAIFGVVNRVLLNPLPYPGADRIVFLELTGEPGSLLLPVPTFVATAWNATARTVEGIEGYVSRDVFAYHDDGSRVLPGMRITPTLPTLLGVSPLVGRGFTAADAEPGAPAVVILSYAAWQRDYGGARDVVGQALTLDDVSHVVIGVMPPRWEAFAGGLHPEVWFPLSLNDSNAASPTIPQFVTAFTRAKPDVSLDTVSRELDGILSQVLAERVPLFGTRAFTTRVQGASQRRVSPTTRQALLALFGAVGLVLLVACLNVANLLLARGASRARELALRSALGASGWRLVRAFIAECLVLALAAGAVGVVFGWVTLRIIMRLRPNALSALGEVQLDSTVLAFTLSVTVATMLLCGVAPALQLRSRRLGDALRHGASGLVRSGSGARLRKLLVGAQMALSVVLLVSAGLLVRSFIYLQNVDVGFDTENLFSANLSLPRERYQEPTSRAAFAEQLLERLRDSPSVDAVTQVSLAPPNAILFSGSWEIRGVTISEADLQVRRGSNSVQPDYFDVLGIRLLDGRTFTADEVRSGAAVIVNSAAAQRYWPEGRVVGSEIKWGRGSGWVPVVGIVDDVVSGGLMRRRNEPQFYWPLAERAASAGNTPPSVVLLVRAAEDTAGAIVSLRAAVRGLDPGVAVASVLSTDTALANTIEGPRFNMALFAAFASIAVALAAVGLAAVIGYEVAERTYEFGIRMALGARTDTVRRLAMRHGLTPAFVGIVAGLIGALAATRLSTSLLHGVAPSDPLTFVGVISLLVLVALGASWASARRATHVDPITALRVN